MDNRSRSMMMGAAGAGEAKPYVEDVFSTWLYTGNGAPPQTVTNGIDLSGKGGLTWFKPRSTISGGENGHQLWDTARGTGANRLQTNTTDAAGGNLGQGVTSFNSDGVTFSGAWLNETVPYALWTFRKAAKFFDVVTYTGNGSNQNIAHNLGSVPGFVIIKRTNTTGNWSVYHRSIGNNYLLLNTISFQNTTGNSPRVVTADTFQIYGNFPDEGANGSSYVMYLFAHDAGGFGDSGNENVISCGSYTGNGSTSGPTVTLGWEPQWLMFKRTDSTGDWQIIDTMRGWSMTDAFRLRANISDVEAQWSAALANILPTGFQIATNLSQANASGGTYIYIAIRRGPMKTPTDATKVFNSLARTGTGSATTVTGVGFPLDLIITKERGAGGYQYVVRDRLRGQIPLLQTQSTDAEIVDTTSGITSFTMDGFVVGADGTGSLSNTTNQNTRNYINWSFRRAPGFFDVVAYTGTGSARTVSHNLGVAPEWVIVKQRSGSASSWILYSSFLGASKAIDFGYFGTAYTNTNFWNNTSPTSSVFSVGGTNAVNVSGQTYIAYLFASCPGVSKVGSYTGTGTTLNIDCGFTNGARLVIIKSTDQDFSSWYVWDTARGIIAANDPYLLLDSTAAEVTNTDFIDPLSSGFQISSTAPAAINASGGSFIYLAIA